MQISTKKNLADTKPSESYRYHSLRKEIENIQIDSANSDRYC